MSLSDQWQRLYLTKKIDYSDRTSALVTMGNNPSGGAGTNILYWGAQLEKASNPSRYVATTTNASTQYLQGVFSEGLSTNLASYSNDFSQSAYTKNNSTVSLSTAITAPDGSAKVYKHIPNSGTNASNIYRSISTGVGGQPYTMSVYVKAAEYTKIFIGQDFANLAVVDLSNGTVVSGSIYRISNVGNGWYRISRQGSGNGLGNFDMIFGALSNSYSLNGNNTPTQSANGSSGVYFWGFQLEAHSSSPYVPSSFMATGSTSLSRGTDSLSYPSTNFIPSAATLSANYTQLSSDSTNRNFLFSITDSGNSRFALRTSDGGAGVPMFVVGNGTSNSTISFSSGSQSYNSQNLIFGRYNSSASSLTLNGSSLNGTGGYIDPGSTTFLIGSGANQNVLIKNIKSSSRYFDPSELYDFGF